MSILLCWLKQICYLSSIYKDIPIVQILYKIAKITFFLFSVYKFILFFSNENH